MVTWNAIKAHLEMQSEQSYILQDIHLVQQSDIPFFPLVTIAKEVVQLQQNAPPIQNHVVYTTPAPEKLHLSRPLSRSENAPSRSENAPSRSENAPSRSENAPRNNRTPRRSVVLDPISIGIRDPLYEDSPQNTKHQMECAESLDIETRLAELYASQGGRSRGWIKKNLEEILRPRCASGGNIAELTRAKVAFLWNRVQEEKHLSAFLDFLCVAKKIRICVWDHEQKVVTLFPGADYTGPNESHILPLHHITIQGTYVHDRSLEDITTFLQYCNSNKFTLSSTHSVIHSLSKLTLPELQTLASKLGLTLAPGKKADYIKAISLFRIHQRLGIA